MKVTTSKIRVNHQGQPARPFREVKMVTQNIRLGLGIIAILMISTIIVAVLRLGVFRKVIGPPYRDSSPAKSCPRGNWKGLPPV